MNFRYRWVNRVNHSEFFAFNHVKVELVHMYRWQFNSLNLKLEKNYWSKELYY